MRHIGYIIASFFLLLLFVGLAYVGLSYMPFIQTNVLLPVASGFLSFQVEHEDSFRLGEPHQILISIKETAEKIVRSGYIDISFEPGTTFLRAEGVQESGVQLINTEINQTQGYARMEIVSTIESAELKLRPAVIILLQVDQVPVTNSITLQISGVFSDEKIPPVRNEILPAYVEIPVLYDATKVMSGDSILAEHAVRQTSLMRGQLFGADLNVNMPAETKRAQVGLIYEPEFLEVANIILNNKFLRDDLLVDEKKGEIIIKATLTEAQEAVFPFATIEYKALKPVSRTGVTVNWVRFIDEAGKIIEHNGIEEVDDINMISIQELDGKESKEVVGVIEITTEPEDTESINEDNLTVTCDFSDITTIAKRKDLSLTQIQELINDMCYVVKKGFMRGYPDGTFGPEKTMNRAEFAKVATLLVWDESAIDRAVASYKRGEKSFALVYNDFSESEEWFYRYVLGAKMLGIAKGYADGTYRPTKAMNRAEAAKILTEAMSMKSNTLEKLVLKNSIDGLKWFEKYMNAITSLFGDYMLIAHGVPDEDVTRLEVAQLIAGFTRFIEQ